jgi:hypothetical protein
VIGRCHRVFGLGRTPTRVRLSRGLTAALLALFAAHVHRCAADVDPCALALLPPSLWGGGLRPARLAAA